MGVGVVVGVFIFALPLFLFICSYTQRFTGEKTTSVSTKGLHGVCSLFQRPEVLLRGNSRRGGQERIWLWRNPDKTDCLDSRSHSLSSYTAEFAYTFMNRARVRVCVFT